MEDCVFCQIVAGHLPCFKIFEDKEFLAFMDIRPLNPGNSLLIPKIHYPWVVDVPEFAQYWLIAKKIALASIPAVKADYVSFLTLGLEVPHAHIRIIPRFYDDSHQRGIDTTQIVSLTATEMSAIADKIKSKL